MVPLTTTLATFLRTLPTSDAPFVNWNGRQVASIKKTWANLAEGFPDWFHPKVLRHTVATELRRRGVPAWDVAGLMGHRKGTTEIYAKLDPNLMPEVRKALDDWMSDLAKDVPRLSCSVVPSKKRVRPIKSV